MFEITKFTKSVMGAMVVMSACQAEASVLIAKADNMMLAAAQTTQPKSSGNSAVIQSLLNKARYWREQGRMDLAASTWERVLRSNPAQEEALAGLVVYQASVGHPELADGYLAKLKEVNPKHPLIAEAKRKLAPALVAAQKQEVVAQKQEAVSEKQGIGEKPVKPAESVHIFVNPWETLDEARALRSKGENAAATGKIVKMAAISNDAETNYAGAIFYAEENNWVQALALLDRIPVRTRGEVVRGLRARAVIYVRCDLAKKLYADGSKQDAYDMLTSAENDAAGNPELLSLASATWSEVGQPGRGAALLERNQPLVPRLQVQYGGLLLDTNQNEKVGQLLAEIDASGEDMGEYQPAVEHIRIVYSVRKIDALRQEGKLAEANDMMAPLVEKHPKDIDVLLTHGRLRAANNDLGGALKSADAVLAQDPGNHEAIRQGAVYSIWMRDFPKAESYLAGIKSNDTDAASLYVEAGNAATNVQDPEMANNYYTTANKLGANVGLVDITASPERMLTGAETKRSSYVETGYAVRYKTGIPGLASLYETDLSASYHMPIDAEKSSLVFKANQVTLNAGDVGGWFDLFGTNLPLPAAPAPYQISDYGTALSVGYQSNALSADIGISPYGFLINNVVGGARWNTDWAGNNIALEASRRSVAESVLSYGGVRDNLTGIGWGGVTKNGAQASIYRPFEGPWAGYASMGMYKYKGTNVADNGSVHGSATLIYQIANTADYEASIAARLSHASFSNNQNWYWYGHGGYYSPQRDNSFAVPLHVAGKTERLSYEANVTASVASVFEGNSLVYPNNPGLQAGLGAAGVRPSNANAQKGGMKVDWTLEYSVNQGFVVGHRFSFDETANYQQVLGMLYLRFDLDGKALPPRFPPNPIRPYHLTTQGGAGLN